jgi:hypothetical protein
MTRIAAAGPTLRGEVESKEFDVVPFIGPHPAPGSAAHEEAKRRRNAALSAFAVPLILTVGQVLLWHDWSFLWKLWVVFGGMGLYWLWLSGPRLGSARFEALVIKHAVAAVPLAFLLGVFVVLLATL